MLVESDLTRRREIRRLKPLKGNRLSARADYTLHRDRKDETNRVLPWVHSAEEPSFREVLCYVERLDVLWNAELDIRSERLMKLPTDAFAKRLVTQ